MALRTLVLTVGTLGFILAVFGACSAEPVIEEVDAGQADTGAPPADGGGTNDAGGEPPSDAGQQQADAGTGGTDAGETDAGAEENDAGEEPDAGTGPADAGIEPGVRCGSVTCGEGEVCCIDTSGGGITGQCASSCPDAGSVFTCDGPEDCTGGDFCCGELLTNGGTPPNCSIASANTTCSSTCQPVFNLNCASTNRVRMCQRASDCSSDPTYSNCCVFSEGGEEVSFCTPSYLAGFALRCAQ